MNNKKIGDFIRKRRKDKNLTQMELAERLNVSNRTISKWENGNCLPDYSIFNDLCNELDISINELFQGEELSKEDYQKKLEERFILIDKSKIKKKRIKRIIFVIITLIIIYLLYKFFILYYFVIRLSNDYQKNIFPYNHNISELKIINNKMDNTSINNDISIYIPNKYELITDTKKSNFVKEGCSVYINNLNDKNFDAAIIICNNDFDNIINLDHYGINNSIIPFFDSYSILKKNKINDIVDILQYYEKHYNDKMNIFTNNNKIKMYYIAKQYVEQAMPSYNTFYYLKGNLRGFLINNKYNDNRSSYQANIYYKENDNIKSYSISLINNKKQLLDYDLTLNIISSIQVLEE